MDEEEKSILVDFESDATYALINATDPDDDTSRDRSVRTEDDAHHIHSSSSPSTSQQGIRSFQTSPTHPHPHRLIADQHREYPEPSPMSHAACASPSEHNASPSVSISSQKSIKSPIAPTHHYGTFEGHRKKRPNVKGRRSVTFELTDEQEERIRRQRRKYSDPNNAITNYSNIEYGEGRDIRIDNACLLSKEDVDHMCDDASEQVRYKPNASHWKQILCASVVLCPMGGIASAIFAYRSKRYFDTGQKELAKQMLRHSDFCLRCATIFGIIFWFLVFLVLVVNKEKLV